MPDAQLSGTLWTLVLFDVAEEIDMPHLRSLLGAAEVQPKPAFRHPTPGYVRFETPPAVETLEAVTLSSGERHAARLRYFDYGVISLELEIPFACGWPALNALAARAMDRPDLESTAQRVIAQRLEAVKTALKAPYDSWLSEDYHVIHIAEARIDGGTRLPASELLTNYGQHIAQLVRGEAWELSANERKEALDACLSYYPQDLLAAGWVAAVVYDTPENLEPTLQLLEYANSVLLQYRHYDDVLTRELQEVYRQLEKRGTLLRHWRMARRAEHLNTLRLDIIELTERSVNAIKFLSDMYYARAYRMAAARIGVPDYRALVEEKLQTAGDLYRFLVEEFNHSRAFLLEVTVVLILLIELADFFRR